MGQAFDDQGGLLGEAFGETKRAVFDQLIKEHPEAHEIRVKSLADKILAADGATDAPLTIPLSGDRLQQFFRFDHLPPRLQIVSKPFADLASHILMTLPSNPERTVALRKLLEAKDCAVRALLFEG